MRTVAVSFLVGLSVSCSVVAADTVADYSAVDVCVSMIVVDDDDDDDDDRHPCSYSYLSSLLRVVQQRSCQCS